MVIGTSGQPFVFFRVKSLDIEPKGVHPRLLEIIQILRGESVAIGFNQYQKIGMLFDQLGTFAIELRTTGYLATGKSDNVSEVFTAVKKAELAFQTLMQMRNKLLDAYDEIRQMRI